MPIVLQSSSGKLFRRFGVYLQCIATEADLICESLRRGADATDFLIEQSCEIRMCALSLMNCNSDHSVAAAAAMMGIAKEAKARIEWMIKMKELLDDFNLPDDQLMEKTFFAPGGHVDDIASSEAAKTTRDK
uniref:Uncharacterized protein n=2 Tax=Oryza barthii TaxID=65489 RepID=A0A0D3FRW4_9ORYZ